MRTRFEPVFQALSECCPGQLGEVFDGESPRVRLHEPGFGHDEIRAALECLLSTRVTMGERVREFERAFAKSVGCRHAVMVNSGSSANLLAISALANPSAAGHFEPGDEVIVPALSWSTTYWPLVQNGLVPVVVDIDPQTWNIDPEQVRRAIGPRTRAIMPVHLYGNPCDMDALCAVAGESDLSIVEDCCEALGASYKGRAVGAFSRISTFSFYFSHHITTIEGGMCVTDDAELADLLRILRSHGWVRDTEDPGRWSREHPEIDPRFLFVNVGFNLRPMELQAAMGLVQLGKLSDYVGIRAGNVAYWRGELERFSALLDWQRDTPGGLNSCFGLPVAVRDEAPFSVQDLVDHLASKRIETRPINVGNIVLQPAMKALRHRVVGDLSVTDDLKGRTFTFGNHQNVDRAARAYIVDVLSGFIRSREAV